MTHESKISYCSYTVYVGINYIYIDYVSTVVLDLYGHANLTLAFSVTHVNSLPEGWSLQLDHSFQTIETKPPQSSFCLMSAQNSKDKMKHWVYKLIPKPWHHNLPTCITRLDIIVDTK